MSENKTESKKHNDILFAVNTKRITLPLVYFLSDKIMIDTEFLPYDQISDIRIFHKATLVSTGSVEIICRDEPFFFQYGKKEEAMVLSAIEMVNEKIQTLPSSKKDAAQKEKSDKPAPRFSVADEILKFKHLLDIGAITEEEYEREKKKLLNG